MAASWGVSNPDAERRRSESLRVCFFVVVVVGDSDLTDPDIKCLLKRTREGSTGFRQAAVKLGELTMAALFLAGDMGWEMGRMVVVEGGDLCNPPETLSLSKVTTN